MTDFPKHGSCSNQKAAADVDVDVDIDSDITPKAEDFSYDSPSHSTYSRIMGDNVASSSCTSVRSYFIAMGFNPSLVDKAIKANGEGNVDLILETLFTYSALESPNSDNSDSVDDLFEDDNEPQADSGTKKTLKRSASSESLDSLFSANEETFGYSNNNRDGVIKEEPDVHNVVSEKRASLLGMRFSRDEVESALNKLGEDAPVNDLVDFIFAARMADKFEKGVSVPAHDDTKNVEQCSMEALFGTMEKTLKLFEMGFSEQQISTAIDKCGSEVPISELAASIVAQDGANIQADQYFPSSASTSTAGNCSSVDPFRVKAEECNLDDASNRNFDFLEKLKGKRPQENNIDESHSLKRPKEEYDLDWSGSGVPAWLQDCRRNSASLGSLRKQRARKKVDRVEPQVAFGVSEMVMPRSCKTHDKMVAEPPYFFYGSNTNLTSDSWFKISQFLYSIQPEIVNTESFSALSRQEGYVHNLPSENRFQVSPKPPMTIEEALPQTRKWWPSWDTRKKLSCISCETKGIAGACERMGRIVDNSRGVVPASQQAELIQQCQSLNLVWVGRNKLGAIEPVDIERILGYPVHHTRCGGIGIEERLKALKDSFQVDTLAFHLSALKSVFPQGLTLLSIYTGIGGAEIALHKLGIEVKVMVSVEPCETKRRIVKYWWEKEGMSGELVQIESIRSRAGSSKLEGLISKYHGFDMVVGQNPPSEDNKQPTGMIDFQLFYEFVRAVQRVRSAVRTSRQGSPAIQLGSVAPPPPEKTKKTPSSPSDEIAKLRMLEC